LPRESADGASGDSTVMERGTGGESADDPSGDATVRERALAAVRAN